jgi:hypothetical protein
MKGAMLFIILLISASTVSGQTKGAITGHVVADDGGGMASVTVILSSGSGQGGQRRSTTTDEEGNFRFTDLPARAYIINVVRSREYVEPPAASGGAERRYYRIGETANIALIKGGVITGRVTNAAGEPLIGMRMSAIRVRDAEARPSQTAATSPQRTTDDRGVYRIYGLQPGRYIVVANSSLGYSGGALYYGEAPTYYPSSTRDAAAEVTVASGSEASGIDIRYRGEPGYAVSGKITGADLAESTGTLAVYLNQATTAAGFGVIFIYPNQGSANFAFYGVPDGEYELSTESYDINRVDGFSSQPRRVTVKGADATGIELKLAPQSSIAGKVVLETLAERCDEKRRPAPEEIILQVRRDDAVKAPPPALSFPRDASANEKGEFLLRRLNPARYRLQVNMPDESWYLKSLTAPAPAGIVDIARSGIPLKAGERVSGITVTIAEGAASLRGSVAPHEEGARLPAKMTVHLVPAETASADDALRYAEAGVERDNSFEFKNLAPGKYRLLVRAARTVQFGDSPPAPVAWDANERAKLRKEAEAMKTEVDLKPCQRVLDQILKYR